MHAEAVDLGDWGLLMCHQNWHNIFEQMAAAMKLNHQDYRRSKSQPKELDGKRKDPEFPANDSTKQTDHHHAVFRLGMQTTRTNNLKEKQDPEHAKGASIGPHDDGKDRRKD